MKKRILALFLVLCTALWALPAALAEDALTSEAVDSEIAAAIDTGADGLSVDDGSEAAVAKDAPAFAASGWQHNSTGWWYVNADGSYPSNAWKKIDGVWYYFNASGYMHTGWLQQGGKWYYMNSSGAMVANTTLTISGTSYTFDSTGAWVQVNAGWKKDGFGWWYQNADGTFPKNAWKRIDGSWYHFDALGYMQTGWLEIDNEYYYFKGSGAMATGWVQNNGKWYYMNANGAMQFGRIYVGGNYYYMEDDEDEDDYGAMLTETWVKESGRLYYYGANGAYQSNAIYRNDIYFLVGCYVSDVRTKVVPNLLYNNGLYFNLRFSCECNSSGQIKNVIITDEDTYDTSYHLFGVRPGMSFYSALSSIQDEGFRQVASSNNVYMYKSNYYSYPVYIIRNGNYIESIVYGII